MADLISSAAARCAAGLMLSICIEMARPPRAALST
jgi:hypothetical protein